MSDIIVIDFDPLLLLSSAISPATSSKRHTVEPTPLYPIPGGKRGEEQLGLVLQKRNLPRTPPHLQPTINSLALRCLRPIELGRAAVEPSRGWAMVDSE